MKKLLSLLVLALLSSCTDVTNNQKSTKDIKEVTINMSFFGDVFWGRRMQTWSEQSNLRELYPFSGLDTFGKKSDENWIGNLECPVTSTDIPQSQQESLLKFNCKPEYLPHAAKYFDVFSLANNHMDNMNAQKGLDETRANLSKYNLQYFGHFDNTKKDDLCEIVSMKSTVKYTDSTTAPSMSPVALCGYHNLFQLPTEESLKTISEYAKFYPTIIMPHQGREYISHPDNLQKEIYRKMIDLGADMVIGGHTHSVIDTEVYKGKLIADSIGNFIFDQQGSEMKRAGLVVNSKISFNPENAEHLQNVQCRMFKDSCLALTKRTDFVKPKLNIIYDARVSDNNQKLTKIADPQLTQRILHNANWSETQKNLTQ
jgi:hypothetical protein